MLAKYDMTADEDEGLVASIKLPEGLVGGEFVMVPRSSPSSAAEAEEDDGWLVGYCTHEDSLESFCMVRSHMHATNTHCPCCETQRQHITRTNGNMRALFVCDPVNFSVHSLMKLHDLCGCMINFVQLCLCTSSHSQCIGCTLRACHVPHI